MASIRNVPTICSSQRPRRFLNWLKAAASLTERDSGKSLEIARRIIADAEKDPIVPWAHNLIGFVLDDEHKTDEAIAEYRKAIELDPRDALPHTDLAMILRAQGKTKEADAQDQKAKELGAKHPD